MTDLEKRADEYADKRARASNMPKSSFVIPLLKVAYKTGATQETALLSQHIIDLQKDKGNLTDRVRELEQQIEKMKCCENCKYNSYWGNELHCNYGLKEALQEDKLVECKNMDKWEIKENE
jgi:hypothetical protein